MRTKWGPFQQFGPHEDQVLNWGPLRTHWIIVEAITKNSWEIRPGNKMTHRSSRSASQRRSWGTLPMSWSLTSSPLQYHRSRCKELGPWAGGSIHNIFTNHSKNGTKIRRSCKSFKWEILPGALVKFQVLVQYGFVGLGVHLKRGQKFKWCKTFLHNWWSLVKATHYILASPGWLQDSRGPSQCAVSMIFISSTR